VNEDFSKMNTGYGVVEPTRTEIDSLGGATVVEFGAPWCGYCRGAQPLIASALSSRPEIRHIKIEDGKGRPLGRSFRVTLWPTLIFLKDGKEIARLIRPADAAVISEALDKITAA
jgi:thioredoxin 1